MDTAAHFEAHRPLLRSMAYRLVGTVCDAEDLVQETWLRFARQPEGSITHPRAWLTTTLTRLALDHLGSARVRRESYVGPWLPEPLPDPDPEAGGEELASSLSMAFLLLLERLGPAERVVFLMREAFDCEYGEIAATLGKSEATCRQIHHRASEHLRAGRPRFSADRAQQEEVFTRFMAATGAGDLSALLQTLAPGVVAVSDGGGKATAALRPVEGAQKVGALMVGLARKAPAEASYEPRWFNGQPGLIMRVGGSIHSVLLLEITGPQVTHVFILRNPDKLAHLG